MRALQRSRADRRPQIRARSGFYINRLCKAEGRSQLCSEGKVRGERLSRTVRSARRVTDGRSEEGPAGARLASRFARAGRSGATGGRSAEATPGARAWIGKHAPKEDPRRAGGARRYRMPMTAPECGRWGRHDGSSKYLVGEDRTIDHRLLEVWDVTSDSCRRRVRSSR